MAFICWSAQWLCSHFRAVCSLCCLHCWSIKTGSNCFVMHFWYCKINSWSGWRSNKSCLNTAPGKWLLLVLIAYWCTTIFSIYCYFQGPAKQFSWCLCQGWESGNSSESGSSTDKFMAVAIIEWFRKVFIIKKKHFNLLTMQLMKYLI